MDLCRLAVERTCNYIELPAAVCYYYSYVSMDAHMTVLISGGDSFTAGSELPSPEHAWPQLLADRMNWNHCATAMGGASNSNIRRNVMNAVQKYNHLDLHVAVMWSFPNRYEFRFTYETGQRDSPWYNINPWTYNDQNFADHFENPNDQTLDFQKKNRQNAEARGMSDFARMYVDHVADSEYWELYTSWCEIVMLQNYLQVNNIPYTFMQVDNSLWHNNFALDTTLSTLFETIDASKWPMATGMYNWAKQTKQPFYTTHPQEIAHVEWINMLYDRIDHGHT